MKVFAIAGEASGDRLGAALMAGLRARHPGVTFTGVGGPEMAAEGLVSRFPMQELSVMGLAEILPKYRHLKRRIAETAAAVRAEAPDVLITIDSPDFCLRVAKLLRQAPDRPRIVHYVAPTVWAWRPKRAAKVAALVDQVLALFPFEPPYLERAGVRCDFVGHPVVAEPQPALAEVAAYRAHLGIGLDTRLVVALPGSRAGEVRRLAPVFGDVLERVFATHPDMRVLVPTVSGMADLVAEAIADWPGDPLLLDPRSLPPAEALQEKRTAFAAADAALAASGTVSLELAAAGTPMVIAWDTSWLTRVIAERMMLIDTFTLVNLVSETRAVPEFIGRNCRPAPIAAALSDLLRHGGAEQTLAMAVTMERLGREDLAPGLRAADAVLDGMQRG